MLNRIFSATIAVVACIAVQAQGVCIIKGSIADNRLSNGKQIKSVYLVGTDIYGKEVVVSSAKVKKGSYKFEHKLKKDEPTLLYTIKGFEGEKGIGLFIEAGEIAINTEKATQPEKSSVDGTATNDTYSEYKEIKRLSEAELAAQKEELEKRYSKEWLTSKEGTTEMSRISAAQKIKEMAEEVKFLTNHNASPMTPYVMEHNLLDFVTQPYAEQMTKSISVTLHKHPYYLSLRNAMLAGDLKVGNEVPDITIPTSNGTIKKLSDFRGKYILLDFWASSNDSCINELDNIIALSDATQNALDKFTIISFSLDKKKEEWKNTIKEKGLEREGWVHCSDLFGWDSPAAKLLNVKAIPAMILIDPEGIAISLDIEGAEIVQRVEQILSGDLYYLDQQE